MKLFKKAISLCLALMMVVTLVPMTVVQTEAATTVTFEEMLERAEAIVNYTWVPSQRIYTWNGNKYNGKTYFEAGQTVTGMPYTLFSSELGFDSLLSLIQYKNKVTGNYSVTEYCNSVGADRIGPAYGSCCATFVSEVFGGAYMNGSNPRFDSVYGIEHNSAYGTTYYNVTASNIRSGDALSNSTTSKNGGHIVWIGEVTSTTVTIYEQTPPVAKKTVVPKTSVNSSGYLIHDGAVYSTVTRSNQFVAKPSLPTVDIPEGEYVFHCVRAPEKVLDIQYDSKEKGANVQLYENLYNTVQKFRVVNMGDYYCIQSVHSGMWLDIAYPYNEDNCNIQLWDTNTSQEQKWVFQDAGDGNVYIKSLYGMYLDTGGATDNGTNIRTWHFDGSTSQQWKLIRTSDGDRVNVDEGIYTIHSVRNPSKVLDIAGNSLEERANIQLYDDLNDTVQQFRIIKENNYYLIQSVWSGHWLDIAAPFNESGANVQLFSMNTNTEEKWVFEDAGNGNVYIRSLYETYVDTKDGATDNHTNVQMYTFDGTTSMQWTLHKVYDVTYDANESVSLPDKQFKQENISLTLRNDILKDPVGYTITYNGNEGLVQIVSKKVSRVFAGWRCDKDGKLYAPGASFDGNFNTEMTAEWSNPQVGTLPMATRKGYSFEGWFTSETGGVRVTEETILQIDTEIYAQWKKLPVVGLDLVSQPHKTVYVKGEQFDETGIALRAHYEDGSDELLLDGFEVEGFSSDSIGNKIVSVKKDGCVQQFVVRVTVLGDLNVDERITISDVADLLDVLSGKKVAQVTLADANADGSLTIADVATILDSIAGKDIV